MTTILAIDPGSEQSAWLVYHVETSRPLWFGISPNSELRANLRHRPGQFATIPTLVDTIVIEQVRSYGMPVGKEVFDTVYWTGRFAEAAYPIDVNFLPRKTIVTAICGSARAKDANVRQALLDRIGPAGTKKEPGPTHGISRDVWSALAIAVAWADGARA